MTKKYNLEPAECWVVGDKWIDPQTGINAGMRGALVKTGKASQLTVRLEVCRRKQDSDP